jgi:hypothetical protein
MAGRNSLFRSLTGSWAVSAGAVRGSFYIETPKINFGNGPVLSGHYDCHENIITNCGNVTASFAYLVIAIGVLMFGIYVVKQRRQPSTPSDEAEDERVLSDEEGWETKLHDGEEG